ncbi:MAG: Asp-tRNA(Asn)/Glu-tRNA(Gln) amidotransferase subunit GatB [Candidatus Hadarchaeia archaeon]
MKIGFEIHEQLNTKQKLYCDCPTNYRDSPPNSNTCPVCTGMPGSKPYPTNKKAVDSAIEIALMLNCNVVVDEPIYIQRKHYDYPDLPSGYQRTSLPLAADGEINGVGIREVHIEEDPGKYDPEKGIVDFNRSGVPLVEIITDPDIQSPEEARNFLKTLTRVLEYTGKIRPEPSTMRMDTNISLEGGNRVEIKNINSIKGAFRAIKYEVMRQERLEDVKRETRAYMESQMITVPMRSKELAEDYRYIPDPDLFPLEIDEAWVENIRKKMPEAPHLRKQRIIREYEIDPSVAEVLVSEQEFIDLFEEVAKEVDPEFASHWFKDKLRKVLNYKEMEPREIPFTSKEIIDLLKMIEEENITPEQGEMVLRELIEKPRDPSEIVEDLEIKKFSKKDLKIAVKRALDENPEAVNDYKEGKNEALNFLAGQIMKITEGKADAREAMDLLREELNK